MLSRVATYLRAALPRGGSLPEHNWQQRHRLIVWLLWLSVVGTAVLAILADALLVLVRVLVTPWMPRGNRKPRPVDEPEPLQAALEDAVR
jgi:hypothetical protein